MSEERIPLHFTDREIEELTTYSPRHLARLAADGAIPAREKGGWPRAVVPAVVAHCRQPATSADVEDAKRRRSIAEAANAEHQAALAEIELERARNTLVLVADVEKWANTVFVALRQGILGSRLSETERNECLAHLKRLTIEASSGGAGSAPGREPEPAPKAQRRRVGRGASVPVE